MIEMMQAMIDKNFYDVRVSISLVSRDVTCGPWLVRRGCRVVAVDPQPLCVQSARGSLEWLPSHHTAH